MALTKCPNCGKEISDKAAVCLGCGYQLIREPEPVKKKCPDCGLELEEGMTACPNCGCPIDEDRSGMKTKKRLIIVIAMVVAVAVAGIIIGTSVSKARKEQELQEYESLMSVTVYSMISGASNAEACGNLIKSVWYNSIYEKKDSETDAYTRPDGYFVSNFNDALANLFRDSSFSTKISKIEDNQDSVKSGMKQLKNPPEEYEDAYEALSELYNAYLTFTNSVVSPSGSLQSFSSNFSDADSDMVKHIDAMELYLDD